MKKKLLLTSLISLSSIGIANALCTPPATLKCECAHPIVNSEGKLACGTSYCGDKKCMPNGACCETEKFCISLEQGTQCCAENQSCDTTMGCVEGKADIETLCAKAGGTIIEATSGTFCMRNVKMSWYDAEEWCLNNGMTMPALNEMCPSCDGTTYSGGCSRKCSELSGNGSGYVWSASLNPDGSASAFLVFLSSGDVGTNLRTNASVVYAICR